jgi:hypothetical protein
MSTRSRRWRSGSLQNHWRESISAASSAARSIFGAASHAASQQASTPPE